MKKKLLKNGMRKIMLPYGAIIDPEAGQMCFFNEFYLPMGFDKTNGENRYRQYFYCEIPDNVKDINPNLKRDDKLDWQTYGDNGINTTYWQIEDGLSDACWDNKVKFNIVDTCIAGSKRYYVFFYNPEDPPEKNQKNRYDYLKRLQHLLTWLNLRFNLLARAIEILHPDRKTLEKLGYTDTNFLEYLNKRCYDGPSRYEELGI